MSAVWLLLAVVPAATPATDPAAALSAAIDRHLAADWAARGITPAGPADDAEYLRRVYLDVLGRIPRVPEVREFLADPAPGKRAAVVTKLLAMPGHARHFADTTRTEWLPQSTSDNRFIFFGDAFEGWLRDQYRKNTPADQVVRKVLTAKFGTGNAARFQIELPEDRGNAEVGQLRAFYQLQEMKPEQIAAAASRLFVGVKLECAQCHDHPFAPYSKEQFWQMAAFFGEFSPLPPVPPSFVGPTRPQYTKNRIRIPNTEKTAVAVFFDGSSPDWTDEREPREELAAWMTSAQNPYFARNLANRTWARFFGTGLIDPIDEPGDNNPPSHPELLDELAATFAAGGFDNHLLIKAITGSRAYQLSSRLSHPTQADPRRFAKMAMKGLTGHQIFDSFQAATGQRGDAPRPAERFAFQDNRTGRGMFAQQFAQAGKVTETQTSILQALMMMNGGDVTGQTTLASANALAAVSDAPFFTTGGKVEALFLAALARKPAPDELEKLSSYVDRGGPTGDKKKALEDVFWAVLNSTEFLFNH